MAALTNPATTGIRTSEFLVSGGGIITIAAVALGIINADQADGFSALVNTSLIGLGAIASIFGIVVQWLKNRQQLKLKLLETGIPAAPVTPVDAV